MNFLRKVFVLCTGFTSYAEILEVRLGAALGYVAVLLAGLAAVVVAAYVPRGLSLVDSQAQWFDQKVPPFQIRDGQVHYAGAQPVRAAQENFVLLLDTTGGTTSLETNKPTGMLVTRDQVSFWVRLPQGAPNQLMVQQVPVSALPAGTVNGQYVRQWLRGGLLRNTPVILVLLFGTALVLCLAHAWFFTFTASLLERSHPTPLSQAQLLNIALHAVTPAALICAVYAAVGLNMIDYWQLYLVVYAVFLIGAANRCRRLLFGEPVPEEDGSV